MVQQPSRKSALLGEYRTLLIVVGAGAIIAGLLTGLLIKSLYHPQKVTNGCTADAKLCPDGSAVGRTAPNCEFAPCPTP